eukprot:14716963-Ditylum_brightwellii.AAC.1
MDIVPINSPYDECVIHQTIMDIKCTTEGGLEMVVLSYVKMLENWRFNEEEDLILSLKRKANKSVKAARIGGNYQDYMKMMIEKHVQYERDIKVGEDVILIDSFDGVEYLKLKKK